MLGFQTKGATFVDSLAIFTNQGAVQKVARVELDSRLGGPVLSTGDPLSAE